MKKNLSYALDNVGLIYPAIITKNNTTLFRLSAHVKGVIHVSELQRALENILPRFPIFRTYLRKGLFWPYLEENFRKPRLYADEHPCQGYRVDQRSHYPFRICVRGKNIILECSHLITDGFGAMSFLKSLLAEYFFLLEKFTTRLTGVITPYTLFNKDEISDAYLRYASLGNMISASKRTGHAFIEPSRRLHAPFLKILRMIVPLEEIRTLVKSKNVTLTEWLVAVYFAAYQDLMFTYPQEEAYRRPIRITTPADLRKFFETSTLRNFIALLSLEINPRLGVFSFEEILHEVHYSMRRELVAKHFQPFIGSSVQSADARSIASIPLFIKSPIVRHFHTDAMRRETSVLSNLGVIRLPPQLEPLVERLDFCPAPKWTNKRDCSVLSYKNELVISFSRIVESDVVEHFFYQRLVQQGLKVTVKEIGNF